jgi:hypothetical protein
LVLHSTHSNRRTTFFVVLAVEMSECVPRVLGSEILGLRTLLVEDGLGLTTITGLFAIITTLSLGEERGLSSLVLGNLVLRVLLALLAFAVGLAGFGNVNLVRVSDYPKSFR